MAGVAHPPIYPCRHKNMLAPHLQRMTCGGMHPSYTNLNAYERPEVGIVPAVADGVCILAGFTASRPPHAGHRPGAWHPPGGLLQRRDPLQLFDTHASLYIISVVIASQTAAQYTSDGRFIYTFVISYRLAPPTSKAIALIYRSPPAHHDYSIYTASLHMWCSVHSYDPQVKRLRTLGIGLSRLSVANIRHKIYQHI